MEQTRSRSRRTSSRRLRLAGVVILAVAPLGALAAPGKKQASRNTPPAKPARVMVAQAPAGQPPPAGQAPPAAGTPQDPRIIDINYNAERFAVPPCSARKGDAASEEACRTLTQVLRNDLTFESQKLIPDNLIAAIPPLNPDAPNFVDWQGIGATMLVSLRAWVTGGELSVEAKLHAVGAQKTILAKRYAGKADNPRIFAHQLSDEIMALGQQKGVARTKIAFVSDRDSEGRRVSKELYIMDYDGYNPRRVTVNKDINILPNWSPDGRSLAYVSFRTKNPDVYLASIFEGKSSNLTKGAGQNFAPAFSPDGKRIAYSSSRGGNSEIWVANSDGSSPKKLTSSPGADTAPVWSPTGAEIAFTSDRAGQPQIYVMDSEGLNVRRLTNVGNWNDAPAWNPNPVYSEIAYTSRIEGGFNIAVVDLATRQVRQITEGRGSCEYPSWAPSGRHLTFACGRGSKWQIGVADREGRTVTMLPAGPGKNEQPDWGPGSALP
jgi:TolB protein